MKDTDLLRPEDTVTVTVRGPEGNILYKMTDKGFRTLLEAIKKAISESTLDVNPEDCVFDVANDATGIAHNYRLNAHGNLKLIV